MRRRRSKKTAIRLEMIGLGVVLGSLAGVPGFISTGNWVGAAISAVIFLVAAIVTNRNAAWGQSMRNVS